MDHGIYTPSPSTTIPFDHQLHWQASCLLHLAFFFLFPTHPQPRPRAPAPILPPGDMLVATISTGKGSETFTNASRSGISFVDSDVLWNWYSCFSSPYFIPASLYFPLLHLYNKYCNRFLWLWKIGCKI